MKTVSIYISFSLIKLEFSTFRIMLNNGFTIRDSISTFSLR
ncbi:unnamed protein product [Schistosoma margrebowiei]|uniref:Uncharacterized protein n=1 Tax=Schistosoma margrebowiei TaxID=48269 RepID=A0A3P7ZWH5_9TREM|nr:unnamed protein product [Schistosoma margrebowiei]